MGICDKLRRKYIAKNGLRKNWFTKELFRAPSSDFDENVNLDLYTIAFNNAQVIDYQIKLLKKFVEGSYRFIVCDNSSDENISEQIKNICIKNDISYFRIKRNIFLNDPSFSHGLALNWTYYNIIKERKNDFGFIDHDLFPIEKVNINKYLKNADVYGDIHYRENGKIWYLWPGFCFYKYDFMSVHKVDFLPCKRCDTGGSNYHTIYCNLDKDKISSAKENTVQIFQPQSDSDEYLQQKYSVDYINDEWMHSMCASNWVDNDNKNEKIYKILNDYLK